MISFSFCVCCCFPCWCLLLWGVVAAISGGFILFFFFWPELQVNLVSCCFIYLVFGESSTRLFKLGVLNNMFLGLFYWEFSVSCSLCAFSQETKESISYLFKNIFRVTCMYEGYRKIALQWLKVATAYDTYSHVFFII